ncbi:MAG TPA: NAD+ synthase [Candidatus Altiarchaeales archaeon]|nr:NAD+ synthase [Candidatus Altiarchaeales archaeon]
MLRELVLPKDVLEHFTEEVSKIISRYVVRQKFNGVVVGVSGGLDSAVVLKLAVKSGVKVHGMIIPDDGTKKTHVDDAKKLCENLGVEYTLVNMQPIIDSIEKTACRGEADQKSFGNVKARTRMMLNYIQANKTNSIVLGTGNRTEILMGYFTKYGDGGVDLQVIGSLYKSQVRQLAKHLEVPESIITRAPTAGLWPGQTDEADMGMTYSQLDAILYLLIDQDWKVGEVASKLGVGREVVERVKDTVERSAHKRNSPDVIRVE